MNPSETSAKSNATYTPAESNLAARRWFEDARFGLFIHWGVYSVPGRGEWVMEVEGIPIVEYDKFAREFNPVRYDPAQWVALAKRAGMKYITITTRHHDSFSLWDSQAGEFNVVRSTPYGKDLLKPLAEECRRQGLKLFFYYSHLDWRHPDYFPLGNTGHSAGRAEGGQFDRYVDFMLAQLTELLGGNYGEVAGIWFDGWWDQQIKRIKHLDRPDAPPTETQIDWRLTETYEHIHRLQPAALIGNNHHLEPFPGEDFQMFEKDLPGANTTGFSEDARIGALPLETCETINNNWGYHAGDHAHKSTRELIHYLVRAAGMGSNFLLNIGPRPDGTIQPEFVERLEAIGDWLAAHGESIYGTRGGPIAPQPWGVTTQKDGRVYVHVLAPPESGSLTLPGGARLGFARARLLDTGQPLELRTRDADGYLSLPTRSDDLADIVIVLEK
ncbi:MAG TPA: alpha-L-fucosidase [Candidatus Hydrogenedentes bacterium]|nr:alpha-L-fucosidase [Candidatus Hydrogenedentota bacterium]HOR27052.1 alpha-L-fucosidase [Candidatus Sumerlaeota bacterium]HPK02164.1 alpha-L-fucosidase [Candidatus Sumerlaeota bacterium]